MPGQRIFAVIPDAGLRRIEADCHAPIFTQPITALRKRHPGRKVYA